MDVPVTPEDMLELIDQQAIQDARHELVLIAYRRVLAIERDKVLELEARLSLDTMTPEQEASDGPAR